MYKIALLSHSYPTKKFPSSSKFIEDQVYLFNQSEEFQMSVIRPTPYSIFLSKRWRKNNDPFVNTLAQVTPFKYLSFPKKRFPSIIKASLESGTLAALSKIDRPDLVHVHWLYPNGMVIPALKKKGYKSILTIHGSDWYQNRESIALRPIINNIFTDVDWVFFSGPKLRSDVLLEFPLLKEKSSVSYNFVNSEVYTPPAKKEKERAQKEMGWNPKAIHILTVANIREEKGVDILIEALSKKELQDENIQFHIIGSQDGSDFNKKILSLVSEKKIRNLRFYSPVPPQLLIPFYHAADIYVLPSRREGFNVSLLEATATGLPAICTNTGGNNLVIDSDNGIVVPSDNTVKITEALISMINNFSNYDPIQISKKTLRQYSELSFRNRISEVYNSLI